MFEVLPIQFGQSRGSAFLRCGKFQGVFADDAAAGVMVESGAVGWNGGTDEVSVGVIMVNALSNAAVGMSGKDMFQTA